MSKICPYVDICIANEDDAVGIFEIDPANAGDEEKNQYIAKELLKKFPFKMVASVWRTETSITTFKLQSMVYTEGKAYYSKEYFMHILDYIGAGDAYCAGIIYSLINNFDPQKTVEFSNAASFRQGQVCANGIIGIGSGYDVFGKTLILAVFPELYAIVAVAATFMISTMI